MEALTVGRQKDSTIGSNLHLQWTKPHLRSKVARCGSNLVECVNEGAVPSDDAPATEAPYKILVVCFIVVPTHPT